MANFLKAISLLVLFISCDTNGVVSDSKTIKKTWSKEDKISFTLPKLDSLRKHNLFINIRNTNQYKYNNLFLIVEMNFPYGKTIVDTLEYRMANPDGTWLGEGIGNIKENKLWYKENIRFFEGGNYVLNISHAIRNNGEEHGVTNLEGITDVGYTIEKSK